VILVTVLWAVALLSALVMAATVAFRAFSGVVAIDRDRVRADGLLTAGLEVAAGMVATADDTPLAGIESTVTLSSGRVRFRIDDEGGRIDIGQADARLLSSLLRAVGATNPDAVAKQIVQWRESESTGTVNAAAEAAAKRLAPNTPAANSNTPAANMPAGNTSGANTSTAGKSSPPQGTVFTDVHDLLQIPGMQPEWVAAAAPLTTVFGNDTVNPLTAPPEVLAALPGVARARIANFLDTRRTFPTDTARLTALLGAEAQAFLDAKPPQAVSVRLAARLTDGYRADAAAVIVCLKEDRQPYRILAWKSVVPSNP